MRPMSLPHGAVTTATLMPPPASLTASLSVLPIERVRGPSDSMLSTAPAGGNAFAVGQQSELKAAYIETNVEQLVEVGGMTDQVGKPYPSVVRHSVCNLFDPPLTKPTRAIKKPSFPRRRESNLVGCHQILKT